MGIISWIVLGLLAGAAAKFIMPGRDPGGWLITIVLGIAGALVGGFVGSFLGLGGLDGFSLYSFLLAVGGALILLAIYRMMKK